jgi:CheY-like chemotaxis protein
MSAGGHSILVVDDHCDTCEALEIALTNEGYMVETASNGREALRKLYAGLRPHLILMDLMMPVMNGFEFRQAQLADPTLASIPLIAFSAVTDPRETAQHLRAAAYLHKPASIEEMLGVIRRVYRGLPAAG